VLETCDRGSYAEIVCYMFPSELLYEVWCARAAEVDVPRSAALQEWIVSHSQPPYTDTVRFLTGQVDALDLDDADIERMAVLVGEILDLECAFHDAAYLED
jgi:thiaminase